MEDAVGKRAVAWRSLAVSVGVGAVATAPLLWAGDAVGKRALPLKSDAVYLLVTDARTLSADGHPAFESNPPAAWLVTLGRTSPLTARGDPASVDFAAGLERYRRLRLKYGALLVEAKVLDAARGYASLTFVVLVPESFASKKSAAAWCKKRKLKTSACSPIEAALVLTDGVVQA